MANGRFVKEAEYHIRGKGIMGNDIGCGTRKLGLDCPPAQADRFLREAIWRKISARLRGFSSKEICDMCGGQSALERTSLTAGLFVCENCKNAWNRFALEPTESF